jgi:hypothetical protein
MSLVTKGKAKSGSGLGRQVEQEIVKYLVSRCVEKYGAKSHDFIPQDHFYQAVAVILPQSEASYVKTLISQAGKDQFKITSIPVKITNTNVEKRSKQQGLAEYKEVVAFHPNRTQRGYYQKGECIRLMRLPVSFLEWVLCLCRWPR